jgi:hypothetical protein
LTAILGFEKLERDHIVEIYGNPPVFQNMNWPQMGKILDKEEAYWIMLSNFDAAKVAIICHLTDLLQRDKLCKTFAQIAYDLVEIEQRQLIHWNNDRVFDIESYGKVLP